MERWIDVTAAAPSPTVALSTHAVGAAPPPFAVIGAAASPLIYLCRQVMIGVLGWKALDKTSKDNRVAEVMSAITGVPLQPAQTTRAPKGDNAISRAAGGRSGPRPGRAGRRG